MATNSITHSIDAPEKALGMDQDPDPEIPAKARRRQFFGPLQSRDAGGL